MEEAKIIGGAQATFGNHPWQAAFVPRSQPNVVFCGGSLINKIFVLTAAHCVTLKNFITVAIVRLSEHDLVEPTEQYPHEDYDIRKVISHEKYSKEKQLNDIALLELSRSVIFRKHIVPICLPGKKASFAGVIASVSGWGRSKMFRRIFPTVLRQVDIEIIENKACGSWFGYFWRPWGEVPDTWLCAGFRMGGKDSCQGDSGGALVTAQNGRAQIVGIVSFGFGCALPFPPGVYTNVSNYIDWINEKINPTSGPGSETRNHRIIEPVEMSTASPISANKPQT